MPSYMSPGVYVEEVDSGPRPLEGVGTAVAAFVGFAEKGPSNQAKLVSSWTAFTETFGGFIEGSYLAHSVYGYFLNGGGNCYVVRIGQSDPADGDGAKGGARGRKNEPAGPEATLGRIRVVALDPAVPSRELSVEITDAGGENPSDEMFRLVVKRSGGQVEEFDRLTVTRGKTNVANVVNATSQQIRVEEVSSAAQEKPANGEVALVALPATPPSSLRLNADDYVGDVAERTGFGGLEAVDEITMLCVPDLMSAYQQGTIDLEAVKAVQQAMLDHCELMGDRMAILDPPPGLNAQQVKEWLVDKANYDSAFGTLYFPWIKTADPVTGRLGIVPPCGHMAGIWARNDDTRGVHKAPANEVIRGAVSLEVQITKAEHDLLHPARINVLRTFPGRGNRVWGARTLASDAAWRYLNVRRLFNYLEESILNGTNWVVFEPNDEALWARIRRTISAFLVNEWRKGALFGQTPDEAFFVKCDGETNPSEGIDAGQVVCEIGVAPVKPAEFVIFRLSQYSGGTSLVSE